MYLVHYQIEGESIAETMVFADSEDEAWKEALDDVRKLAKGKRWWVIQVDEYI